MKALLVLSATAAMLVLAATPSKADTRRNSSVHLAASSQSTAAGKPISSVKVTTPRKKKRCF